MVEETSGGMPPLKWEKGLFEQVVWGHQFAAEWDGRYPAQGQTAADAPLGYIILFADFFGGDNFRLPATNFFSMVRIRHFEFVCRSQGQEPTVEKFWASYQLQRNLGFFFFAIRSLKKIIINPSKSYHDWKVKFLYIREEVIPIAMEFRDPTLIQKKGFQDTSRRGLV
ncbi:hypothetical protein Hanom_Chr09g00772811 [Helianthus anomalus]